MEFEYLDQESELELNKIITAEKIPTNTQRGTVFEFLVTNDYLDGKCCTTLSDIGPCYLITGITQKGKTYFEHKKRYEKEKKKMKRRDWRIAIISAVIGALVGLIPFIVELISK